MSHIPERGAQLLNSNGACVSIHRGTATLEEGLARMRSAGCPFVVVLGHHEYYPRFGFERAAKYGVRCQWEGVPDEVFMIIVNKVGEIPSGGGVIRYREEFNEAI